MYGPLLQWGNPNCNIIYTDRYKGDEVQTAVQTLGISRSEVQSELPCDAVAVVTFPDNPSVSEFRCLVIMEASLALDTDQVEKVVDRGPVVDGEAAGHRRAAPRPPLYNVTQIHRGCPETRTGTPCPIL